MQLSECVIFHKIHSGNNNNSSSCSYPTCWLLPVTGATHYLIHISTHCSRRDHSCFTDEKVGAWEGRVTFSKHLLVLGVERRKVPFAEEGGIKLCFEGWGELGHVDTAGRGNTVCKEGGENRTPRAHKWVLGSGSIQTLSQLLNSSLKHENSHRRYVNKWAELYSNRTLFMDAKI